MATDIVQGLFGLTPEAYQAQQAQQAQAEALRYAQLDPLQQAAYGTFLGGRQLGGSIGQALGAQDPMLQMISQQQSLLREVNPNDINSLTQAAQKASAFSPQLAMSLADRAKALQAANVKQAQEMAAAQASLAGAAEKQFNISEQGRAQDLLKTAKYTPESVSNFINGTGQLELIDKLSKPTPDFAAKAVELGFGDKPTYGSYAPDQVAKINKAIFNDELAKKAAGAAITKVTMTQEGAFASARGKEQAATINDAATNALNARNTINTIQSMKEKNATGQLYSGPQANVTLETANFLESLNLLSPDQTRRLTNSTAYDKFAKDLVMKDLGGKLGAQVSDADRKYVEARIPQLTTNPQARNELLNKLEEIAAGKINYYSKLNEHANKYGNLNTFDFSQNYAPVAPKAPFTATGGVVDFGSLKR